MPPLKEGRLPKLMGSALTVRASEGLLRPTDFVFLLDGGRDLQSTLLSSVSLPSGDKLAKSRHTLMLHHDEASLRARRKRDKGAWITQMERAYVVSSDEGLNIQYKDRSKYKGTTKGEILGPLIAAPWDETWTRTLAQKSTTGALSVE